MKNKQSKIRLKSLKDSEHLVDSEELVKSQEMGEEIFSLYYYRISAKTGKNIS